MEKIGYWFFGIILLCIFMGSCTDSHQAVLQDAAIVPDAGAVIIDAGVEDAAEAGKPDSSLLDSTLPVYIDGGKVILIDSAAVAVLDYKHLPDSELLGTFAFISHFPYHNGYWLTNTEIVPELDYNVTAQVLQKCEDAHHTRSLYDEGFVTCIILNASQEARDFACESDIKAHPEKQGMVPDAGNQEETLLSCKTARNALAEIYLHCQWNYGRFDVKTVNLSSTQQCDILQCYHDATENIHPEHQLPENERLDTVEQYCYAVLHP